MRSGLSSKVHFLYLSWDPGARKNAVRFVASVGQVWGSWTHLSRISPIVPWGNDVTLPSHANLHLAFVFLADPSLIAEFEKARAWASFGLANLILAFDSSEELDACTARLDELQLTWECWSIREGLIESTRLSQQKPAMKAWRNKLAGIQEPTSEDLKLAHSEFLPLCAGAAARLEQVAPWRLDDIDRIADFIEDLLKRATNENARYKALGLMTHTNAALARLSSQMLSGTPPIERTESHYWRHSLLGTGLANLGLQHICTFVIGRFERHRILNRFERFCQQKCPLPENGDPMEMNPGPVATYPKLNRVDPFEPIISHFSGRDGFRANLVTISAPLASIEAANSASWTLGTITHELSHILVRSVLSFLLPKRTSSKDLRRAEQLLTTREENLKWREWLQRYLLDAMNAIDQEDTPHNGDPQAPQPPLDVAAMLLRWHREIEETMVHSFDFQYFYESDARRYVQSIWTTWAVIPNIEGRVPEYVLRTAAALCVGHRTDEVLPLMRKHLREVKIPNRGYIAAALRHIDEKAEVIQTRVQIMAIFAKFVRTFLFCTATAKDLQQNTWRTPGTSTGVGLDFTGRTIPDHQVDNPLVLLNALRDAVPSAPASLHLFTLLALGASP